MPQETVARPTASSRSTALERLRHIDALDGLRGLAVAAVLLFHGGVSWAAGGFLGVDAFFVLSGYLITSLLLLEIASSGTVRLRAFWVRRIRRLLPALLVTLAGIGAYVVFVAPPDAAADIRGDALAALGYVANWRAIVQGHGYFGQSAAPSPLLHMWSLSIEEQFYLVFPLLMLGLARVRKVRVLAGGAVVLAAASAAWMAWVAASADRAYYGTDTRAQSLLIGVALAATALGRTPTGDRDRSWWVPVIGIVGLAGAVVAMARLEGTSAFLYRGGFLAFSVAVAAVIAAVVRQPEAPLARVLSVWPLAALGRVSYGAYLFHWPLFLVLDSERTGLTGPALLGVRLTVTLAAAALSYWLIERPAQRHQFVHRAIAAAVPAFAVAMVLVVVIGASALPSIEDNATAAPAAAVPVTAPVIVPRAPRVVPSDRPVRVMVIGDSVAMTLAQGWQPVASKYGVEVIDKGRLGCGVVRGGPYLYFGKVEEAVPECQTWPADWKADVDAVDPDVVLVVIGRWEVMDRVHDGTWMRVGDRTFDTYLEQEITTAVASATHHGAAIAIATAPYYKRGERPDGGLWPEDETWRVDRWNQLLRETAARPENAAPVLDLGALLTPDGMTYVVDGVRVRQSDGVHITPAGARWLAPQLLPPLTQLVTRTP